MEHTRNSKGPELVAFENVQLNLGVPAWISRDKTLAKDDEPLYQQPLAWRIVSFP